MIAALIALLNGMIQDMQVEQTATLIRPTITLS